MPSPGRARLLPLLLIPIVGVAIQAARMAQPAPDFAAAVDRIARDALTTTGVPSASIAIVRDGALAYTHAYGNARLPATAATTSMRYSIGSISKQFTSAAILLLQEQRTALTRRRGRQVRAGPHARQRGHDSPGVVAHLGLSGLLAAGLRAAVHAHADQRAGHSRSLGPPPARLRARHAMAVQQHQLRHRGPHRREGRRHAAVAVPQHAGLHAARDHQRDEHR